MAASSRSRPFALSQSPNRSLRYEKYEKSLWTSQEGSGTIQLKFCLGRVHPLTLLYPILTEKVALSYNFY